MREIHMSDDRARDLKFRLSDLGITDDRLLDAIGKTPRDIGVGVHYRMDAYNDDHLIPFGHGRSMPGALTQARMLEALAVEEHSHVLEIGAGSPYETALLSELSDSVLTLESDPNVLAAARCSFSELYDSVLALESDPDVLCSFPAGTFVCGPLADGSAAEGPFDRIIASGAVPSVPDAWLAQLRSGGILVVGVGSTMPQELRICHKGATLQWKSLGKVSLGMLPLEPPAPSAKHTQDRIASESQPAPVLAPPAAKPGRAKKGGKSSKPETVTPAPRPLQIANDLREQLLRLRVLTSTTAAPILGQAEVDSAQKALKATFSDVLLALFANGDDALREHCGVRLEDVVENTREMQAGLADKSLIAIGRDSNGDCFFCVDRKAAATSDFSVLEITDSEVTSSRSVRSWLQELEETQQENLLETFQPRVE